MSAVVKTADQLQSERVRNARAGQAKLALEEEIEHSGASVQQRAYMRQKLEHLWQLVRPKTGRDAP